MSKENLINVPGRLHSVALDSEGNKVPVSGADEIFDDNKGKSQETINEEVDINLENANENIAAEVERASAAETAIDNRLKTVEELAEISIDGGTIGIGTAEDFDDPTAEQKAKVPTIGALLDGADYEPTAGSDNLVKSGGVQKELALGAVYDVSAKNPTAGPNSDGKWESLSALLSDANLNTLIPTAYRKGGMSVKFVQSSDNKYVQARCLAQNFTTNVTQWQGVDDKPTAGSKNLVESSGTKEIINSVSSFYKDVISPSDLNPDYSPYISEVYIKELPEGGCVCKYYDGLVYIACLDPVVYARSTNVNSNGVYECKVYLSENPNYPNGKIVGYALVNDYEGLSEHSTGNPSAGLINKAFCENIFNSPKIQEFLDDTDERLDAIDAEMIITNSYTGTFLTANKWYNTHGLTVGDTPPSLGYTTDDAYAGVFHAEAGKKYIIGCRTTAASDYGRPIFVVVNNLITAIASTNDALTIPFEYNALTDADIYINCAGTYYNSFYINEIQTVKNKCLEINTEIEEINAELYGIDINEPTINTRKSIQVSDSGTSIISSGACNIYTEVIPEGVTKIWTKFNSAPNPSYIGYIFYGDNDTVVGYGQTLAGSNSELNGVWQPLDVPNGSKKFSNTVADITTYGIVKFDYEGIKPSAGLDFRVSTLEREIEKEDPAPLYGSTFNLPKEIHAIKNDKILLFKSAFGNNLDTKSINVENAYCRDFPRYIEVNPTSAVDSTINFSLLNEKYEKLGINTVTLKCVEKPVNPSDTLNILMVGSSSTANYKNQYEELYRRLALTTGTEGNVSNPKGLGLSNVNFIGRLSNGSNFRYEATGGFSWKNYTDPQGTDNNYSFIVSNPSDYNVDDVYTDGTYDFTIKEISQSDNRVSANCATQNAPISSSGSLALKSGTGPQTFVYSSYTATITHPFDLGSGVSLSDYMAAYCNNAIPHIIVFQDLVFNSGCVLTDAIKTKIVGLFNLILTEYPDVKILMSSEPLPSALYGLGTNYVTSSQFGRTALITYRLHKLVSDTIDFIEQFNTDYGSEVVMFVPQIIECDAEYDYPYVEKDVNFRVTSIDEKVGTNGAHPTNEGILNRVDAFYRSIAYCIKNFFN